MTIERYVEQIPQSTDAVPAQLPIERSQGNFLLFQSSAANVTITLFYDGVREIFANVNGGIYIRRIKPWNNLRIDGPIGTSVTYFIGTEKNDKDETDIRQQVAVISGVTATADQPAATAVDQAPVSCIVGTTAVVPVNLNRRRVTLQIDVAATGVMYARSGAFANDLMQMQPGVAYQFNGTYAISIRNPLAGAFNCYILEEK